MSEKPDTQEAKKKPDRGKKSFHLRLISAVLTKLLTWDFI